MKENFLAGWTGKETGHFSLTVAGLRAPLSRFLEGALYKYPE